MSAFEKLKSSPWMLMRCPRELHDRVVQLVELKVITTNEARIMLLLDEAE